MTDTSTAVAKRAAPAPMMAGGEVAPIIPRSVEEMFRIATVYAASGLAPKTLDTKEKVFIAIMAGAELGLPPHQAVQAFYVVNGRPTIWGDAVPALLWANGFEIDEWYENESADLPDEMVAKCKITRPTGKVIPGEFSVADAKRAKLFNKDGPWQTATKRMLKMRARAFAARDGASDVLKGFQIREEVDDYQNVRDVTPQKSGIRARLESNGSPDQPGFSAGHIASELGDTPHDPETGEIIDAEVAEVAETLKTGAQLLAEKMAAAQTEALVTNDDAQALAEQEVAQSDDQGPGVAEQAPPDGQAEADIRDWAASFNRGLAELHTVEEVAGAWKTAKANGNVAKLKAVSEGLAKGLTDAVNARVAEINGTVDG